MALDERGHGVVVEEIGPRVLEVLCRVLPVDEEGNGYEPARDTRFEELIPGSMYRAQLLAPGDHHAVSALLYEGVSELGGHLWEQDVRALLRVDALQHPALPDIEQGGHNTAEDVAYVVSGSADYTMEHPDATAAMRNDPTGSLRQVLLLADALSLLHGQAIVHRGLRPGALNVRARFDDGFDIELARFEMSGVVAGAAYDPADAALADQARAVEKARPNRVLVFAAPEQVDSLLGTEPPRYPESGHSDVFALGVLAYTWFVGDLPVSLDETDTADDEVRRVALRSARGLMREEVTRTQVRGGLPRALAKLLTSMLDELPTGRPSASELVSELRRNYSAITNTWIPDTSQPHRLMYMPEEFHKTVGAWGWISNDPHTPVGDSELRAWLHDELRGATLLDIDGGAEGFVTDRSGKQDLLSARHVLLGIQAAWFCAKYRPKNPFGGGLGDPWDELLLIKYVVPLRRFNRSGTSYAVEREIPEVELVSFARSASELEAERAEWPSWKELLLSVAERGARPEWESTFADALDWLLELQRAEAAAGQWEYELVADPTDIGSVWLLTSRERDRRDRVSRSSLLSHIDLDWPPMGDHFDDLEERSEGRLRLVLYPDDNGPRVDVDYVSRRDPDTIEVQLKRGRPPSLGRVEDASAFLDRLTDRRETAARREFLANRTLMSQFKRPRTVRTSDRRLDGVPIDLKGEAPRIVRDMLTAQPFYALQGPPGTGKTTVSATAVRAQLQVDPSTRVLVSAQSNAALDNLALGVVKELSDHAIDVVTYRVMPGRTDTVDERARHLQLEAVAQREIAEISQRVKNEFREQPDEVVRELMAEWLQVLPDSSVEIAERVRSDSSVVFATCAKSTPQDLEDRSRVPGFDWVLVEEAAKAWPTELAVPLVRGLRWTLIGDHRQLSAHRRADRERLLVDYVASDRPDAERLRERKEAIVEIFDLFGRVFDRAVAGGPVDTLRTQFRMRQSIADVVSDVFYSDIGEGKGIATAPSAEAQRNGLTAPPALVDRPLVWVDTTGSELVDQRRSNLGEAQLVARLHARITANSPADDVVVLTPYLDQLDLLAGHGLGKCSHTVHSFQGSQASIVLVSLVRTTNWGTTVSKNLGHVADPDVVNVMLSRARTLLVLVGNLKHFEQAGDPTWTLITELIRSQGHVISWDSPSLGEGR
ncbi:MAG: hypothetical protein GY798_21050 [Hyphomicrobiales bacterium]|nr:hypothetical protein [Hyphomicrobiales bacterium]